MTIAQALGISDLVIGLTIVAVGTSLPELASSLIAIRKNEHDLALGNVLGSNLFNTLAVVGIAAGIHPLDVAPEVLTRDWSIMMGLTLLLLVMCLGRKEQGRINRLEGRTAHLLRRLHRLAADQSVYLIGIGEMIEGKLKLPPLVLPSEPVGERCAQATATSFCPFWLLSRMRMLALGKKLKVEAEAQV